MVVRTGRRGERDGQGEVNAAWFQTLYGDYDKVQASASMKISDSFTRSNRVIGLGVDIKL